MVLWLDKALFQKANTYFHNRIRAISLGNSITIFEPSPSALEWPTLFRDICYNKYNCALTYAFPGHDPVRLSHFSSFQSSYKGFAPSNPLHFAIFAIFAIFAMEIMKCICQMIKVFDGPSRWRLSITRPLNWLGHLCTLIGQPPYRQLPVTKINPKDASWIQLISLCLSSAI